MIVFNSKYSNTPHIAQTLIKHISQLQKSFIRSATYSCWWY